MLKKFISFTFSLFLFVLLVQTTSHAQVKNQPSLTIITPSEDQTIYGNKIPILLSTENFELTDYQTNKIAVAGQGHIHLWLDDASFSMESAVKLIEDNFIYSDVPFGNHILRAELVTNDHTSLNPPIAVTVNFKSSEVSTPSPAAVTSGFDKNTAVVIFVVVALVIIAAWWYTKEEDEEMAKETKVSKGTKGTKANKKTVKRTKKS